MDAPLRDEIALVGVLVIAAAGSDGHLSQADIDRVLGVQPRDKVSAEAVAG